MYPQRGVIDQPSRQINVFFTKMKKMAFVARPEEGVMGSRVWWVGVPGLNDFDIVCRVEANFAVFSTLAPALFIFVL